MPNPTTPNLGLNKIDRTSPETTYFDLNKYIDQNAEKVDSFAGEVREEISALQDRLDHAETKEITLNSGLQVVNSPKDSRFKLSEIQGRTLINLLGNAGSCEKATRWSSPNGTLSVDTTVSDSGMASLKYAHSSSASSGAYVRSDYFPIDPTKYLLIAAWVKSVSKSVSVRLVTTGGVNIQHSFGRAHTAGEAGGIAFRLFSPADLGTNTSVCVDVYSNDLFAVGDTFNFDSYRVYQLTAEEYAQLNESTPDSYINEKYPFIASGIVGVENPYVFGYGENLLPPFYEWRVPTSSTGEVIIKGAYEIDLIGAASVGSARSYTVKVLPNTNYTYSAVHNGFISVTAGADIIVENNPDQAVTFNTGNRDEVVVNIYNNLLAGVFTFKNPMLVVGNEAKPFKPQRKSMLALQTELYANPTDGSAPDILFEKDGQYFKLKKWKKAVLDGSLNWTYDNAFPGVKRVKLQNADNFTTDGSSDFLETWVTKYNGIQLKKNSTNPQAADFVLRNPTNKIFYLTISNAESGWGDDYTPTADEIKAFFFGWKMQDINGRDNQYNGSGEKRWISLYQVFGDRSSYDTVTATLPTSPPPEGKRLPFYQLLYRLSKEVIEPVPFEGTLVLPEGKSFDEVGTGIVVKEKANPVSTGYVYQINATPWPGTEGDSRLKNPTRKIISIFKNGVPDSSWNISSETYANGKEYASCPVADFDEKATYTVTYLKLYKSTVQPIKGVVAANEKAQISDVIEAAANALVAVSPAVNAANPSDSENSGNALKTVIPYVTTKNGDTYAVSTNEVLKANQQITVNLAPTAQVHRC